MIDLHSHLIPGVDDGARSYETAAAVLRRFAEDGVRLVACTPHLLASAAGRAPIERCAERLDALRALAPRGLTLLLGWEVMLDEPGVDLRAPHVALGGSSAVLVELPRGLTARHAGAELFRLSMSGVVPVLAHAERYAGATPRAARAWRAAGAVIQVDATSLADAGARGKVARALVGEGLADLLASDNHGDARALAPARRWLVEHGAEQAAALLTAENPERLLRNERPLAVPPVTAHLSALTRLRELLRKARLAAPTRPGGPGADPHVVGRA